MFANFCRSKKKQLLVKNKKFIQEEVTAWINHKINTNASVTYSDGTADYTDFRYNSAKCKRDVGYIVDAWINDLSKGGNIETRRMASSYLAGAVNAVNKTNNSNNTVNQIAQTNAALEFAIRFHMSGEGRKELVFNLPNAVFFTQNRPEGLQKQMAMASYLRKELKGLFFNIFPQNKDYIKTRNQYRLYLGVYLLLFITYILSK